MAIPLIDRPRFSIFHATHQQLAARLRARGEVVDHVFVDTPYSKRTHAGHDGTLPGGRSPIPYEYWCDDDVAEFVDTWRPLQRGWLVSITDHVLWFSWQRRAEQAGLYAGFPPIPFTITGSRVRLRGDGPSPSSYWILVARPPELVTWGTIGRSSYYGPRERLLMTGAKPLWGMREIVQDYSRPGQLVCDPLCGTGTTVLAAMLEGRMGIGSDGIIETALLAADRIEAVDTALKRGVHPDHADSLVSPRGDTEVES